VFSPDGKTLATGTWDGLISLWDPVTGRKIREFKCPNGLRALAFSPDGTRLVTMAGDGTVGLWDPMLGQEVALLKGHGSQAAAVAFSPDGSTMVTAGGDGVVRLWRATAIDGR
jgi:WD40 repeat protein